MNGKGLIGRTWADVIAGIPLWLIGGAAAVFVAIILYAMIFAGGPLKLGILGEFGRANFTDSTSFPSGAVIAFDRSANEAPCPDNWERFVPADGRVIVGAGGNASKEVSSYPPQKSGDSRAFGGAEKLAVEISVTLPEDSRRVSDLEWGRTPWANGPNPARGGVSASGQAHIDNMQPYVALFFCRKTEEKPNTTARSDSPS